MMAIYTAALTLFLVFDPFGNVPVFLSVLQHVPRERRLKVLVRELSIALGIIMLFLFFGRPIMNSLHLSNEALSISGGVILLLIAIKMIFPVSEAGLSASFDSEPFIVPLAVPFIAGPSSITMVLLYSSNADLGIMGGFIAIVSAWVPSMLILCGSAMFQDRLPRRLLLAIERLMGMILVVLAMQMLLDGVSLFVKVLQVA